MLLPVVYSLRLLLLLFPYVRCEQDNGVDIYICCFTHQLILDKPSTTIVASCRLYSCPVILFSHIQKQHPTSPLTNSPRPPQPTTQVTKWSPTFYSQHNSITLDISLFSRNLFDNNYLSQTGSLNIQTIWQSKIII